MPVFFTILTNRHRFCLLLLSCLYMCFGWFGRLRLANISLYQLLAAVKAHDVAKCCLGLIIGIVCQSTLHHFLNTLCALSILAHGIGNSWLLKPVVDVVLSDTCCLFVHSITQTLTNTGNTLTDNSLLIGLLWLWLCCCWCYIRFWFCRCNMAHHFINEFVFMVVLYLTVHEILDDVSVCVGNKTAVLIAHTSHHHCRFLNAVLVADSQLHVGCVVGWRTCHTSVSL